jgi:hypothetical protein
MLAKVHQFPTLAEDPSIQSIEVVFDPSASLGSQLTFTGKRYLMVDEPTTISVTLTGGATFASVPVFWPNPPSNVASTVALISGDSISFLVPAPTHYFVPWIFTLNVNYGAVNGITSPAFFLVKTPDDSQFALDYNPKDGSFAFKRHGQEADLVLASQKIMLNVLPVEVTVVLTGAKFHKPPIVWSNGNVKPDWIDVATLDDKSLKFSLLKPINGQSAGFQFAIDVPDGQGGEITILSPDPIVINATIGDG